MRQFRPTLFILLALTSVVASSCNNDDDEEPQRQEIITSDSSSTTGKLTVRTVYGNDLRTIANTDISLYYTYEDLRNDLAIFRLRANNQGIAEFGYVNFGNYYLKAQGNVSGTPFYDEDVVQVQARKEQTRLIILEPL